LTNSIIFQDGEIAPPSRWIPSGKLSQKTMENHHFQWVNPLFNQFIIHHKLPGLVVQGMTNFRRSNFTCAASGRSPYRRDTGEKGTRCDKPGLTLAIENGDL